MIFMVIIAIKLVVAILFKIIPGVGMDDLISVIVPCCNSEKFIKKCLQSIMRQTYGNLEIICIDDASTDNTVKIIHSLQEHDPRIRLLVNEKNLGISLVRNRGIDEAVGKYISFIDADDFIDPDFYGRLLQAAHKTGAEVITTSTSAEWPNKKKIWAGKPGVYQKFADKLAAIRIGSCWNKLYLTDFLRRNELVFPAGLLSEDNLFVIKCLALCKNLGVIDSTRYHYVINPGSLTHAPQIAEKRKKDSLAISCMILEFIRQNVPGARHKIIHFIIKNIISLQYLTDEDYYHTLRQAAGFSPYLIKKRFIALYKFKFRKPRK